MKSLLLLAAAVGVSAHFTLDYPSSIGFSDQNENIAPCGGFIPNLDGSLVSFSVFGDWIQINNHHPESLLHYRIANEHNLTWVDLNPIVHQVGIGKLCIKTGPAPAGFAGTRGVVQVVGDGHGGALFQCLQARFTNATATTPGSDLCSNGTVTAEFNSTAVFGVPSVAYNATSVQVSGSAAASGSGAAASTSAASAVSEGTFKTVNAAMFGFIVLLGLLVGGLQ